MGEQNRSPGRPPAPHKLGPVLKAGWLRKQRSIMKNWQQRWFVLRGDQLLYYKDKDESKPQVRPEGPVSRGCGAGTARGGGWGWGRDLGGGVQGVSASKASTQVWVLTRCVFPYHSLLFWNTLPTSEMKTLPFNIGLKWGWGQASSHSLR